MKKNKLFLQNLMDFAATLENSWVTGVLTPRTKGRQMQFEDLDDQGSRNALKAISRILNE